MFFVISKQNLLTSDIDLCFFMCERVDRLRGARRAYHQFLCKYRSTSMYIVYLPPCICKYICANIYLQGVSKKRSFSRLAPLEPQVEAPRLFIGLEIIPKCYQILYIGQTHPFTHFHSIYGWFSPNYGPKYGPFKQNKVHG